MCNGLVGFEWDANKALANVRKHGVRFTEAVGALSDDYGLTVMDADSDPHEQRL